MIGRFGIGLNNDIYIYTANNKTLNHKTHIATIYLKNVESQFSEVQK